MNLNTFKKIKSPYVILLVGPPLCGKTTFCKKFIEDIDKDVDIISRDQIMVDIHDNDDYNDAYKNVNQKEVNRLLLKQFEYSADNYRNVIVDMTNLFSKRRRHTLSFFDDSYNKIAVIFPIFEWDEFLARNRKRKDEENKFIPEDVLKNMISSYQGIRDNEGFNRIVSI